MKNKFLEISFLFFTVLFFVSGCQQKQNQISKNANNLQPIQNLNGGEISQLKNGVVVRFPAILKQGSQTNCIEIFNEEEFEKYNGDSKWAVASRFAADSHSNSFPEGKKVLVTGKMTLVKEVSDTSKTCGIVTGQLFEITEIQNL